MKLNVGGIDRALRILAGVILVGLAISDMLGATQTIGHWGWIGIIPLATGLISWCPLYLPLGLSSRKQEGTKH